MGHIYKITNKITDTVYIGFTTREPNKRWVQHKNYHKTYDFQLYRAMRKYGVDNFEFKVIEECDNCSEREVYWIQEYDSYSTGYNCTKGGDNVNNPHLQKLAVSKPVYCYELDLCFISVVDAGRWLHQNGYSKTVRGGEMGVNRVLKKEKETYRKLHFNYIKK